MAALRDLRLDPGQRLTATGWDGTGLVVLREDDLEQVQLLQRLQAAAAQSSGPAGPTAPEPPLAPEAQGRAVVAISPRERQVLALVEHHTVSQVAHLLGLAPNTVAQHLVSVRRKYGTTTTTAAIAAARSLGHLSEQSPG